jgi:PhnO protein
MHLNPTIRKIEKNDSHFIYDCLCQLKNEKLDFKIIESILEENTRNPNYHYLIAENEQYKFGFISFHIQNLLHHSGLVGEIQEFFIVEQFRGKGIGKQLVDEIFKISEQLNLKSIEVTTNKKKTDNILVYQSLGFNLSHNKFTIYR